MFDITPYSECIIDVHPSTMQRVIAVESGGNPFAININGTTRQHHPTNKYDAIRIANNYIQRGYSVDMGLTQVNSKNLRHYGVSVADMFDSCINLKTGSHILHDAYNKAWQSKQDPQGALQMALSIYNTGNTWRGFRNGYVERYTHHPMNSATGINISSTTIDIGDLYQ